MFSFAGFFREIICGCAGPGEEAENFIADCIGGFAEVDEAVRFFQFWRLGGK